MERLIQAVLNRIDDEMRRLYWNKFQSELNSPFLNTGNIYQDGTFSVRAFYWGDDEKLMGLPNFQYKDFSCSWYKHSQRGLTWKYKGMENGYIPSDFLAKMLDDCFESMDDYFKKVQVTIDDD